MSADPYIRPTTFEIATCWPHGLAPFDPLVSEPRSPRAALDDALRPALAAGPCYVLFSGGRDSSAVLAAASHLARREGMPEPIPVTRVYPAIAETDESSWQELVIDHLGLSEWIRLEYTTTDLLGAEAREGLRDRGLVWPPALQVAPTVFRTLGTGRLLTGEGGDEVLGARRITPLTLLRSRHRPTRALVRRAGRAIGPRPLRTALLRRQMARRSSPPWLRADALRRHHRLLAADTTSEPLRYDRATWWTLRRRASVVLEVNRVAMAREFGLIADSPLFDPGFVAALAAFGGRWGFKGRTDAMTALFSDVLPAAVLTRTSKARFNQAYSGEATRAFARTWDGSGVDHELVDPDRLRNQWLSDQPTTAAALLLHSAWLASDSSRVVAR